MPQVANSTANITGDTILTAENADTITGVKTFSAAPVVNAGIKFPAAQVSVADVNTLDDYEEGTWTPVLNFGGATTGITYSSQVGTYTKIGNLIYVEFACILTSKGSATGSATITGIPTSAGGGVPAAVLDCLANMVGLTGAPFFVLSLVTIFPVQTTATGRTQLDNTHFSNTSSFRGAITYRT